MGTKSGGPGIPTAGVAAGHRIAFDAPLGLIETRPRRDRYGMKVRTTVLVRLPEFAALNTAWVSELNFGPYMFLMPE
jgi:hypothetical protein